MGTIVIDEEYDRYRHILKTDISAKRYAHSISVSNTAACLAMRYGCDIRKAYIAGLVHDCAKGMKPSELLETVKREGYEPTDIQLDNPELLHALAGSIVARDKYGITDSGILSAVRYHTTGRPGMTDLEEIIFTADYIEPNRSSIPELDRIRQTAFSDIDEAVALICRNTLDYLDGNKTTVDRMTVETYDYYCKHIK